MNTRIKQKKAYYYNSNETYSLSEFSHTLHAMIRKNLTPNCTLIILCIGTDRATGDALGPLIGYKLKKMYLDNIVILGTLEHPIHAKNIEETITSIKSCYSNPYIIAIDACLGKMDHIGYINIGEGSIHPGAGVNKKLPPVGNMFITGIVNFSGFMDILILQNTRLNIVMTMADFISVGLRRAINLLKMHVS